MAATIPLDRPTTHAATQHDPPYLDITLAGTNAAASRLDDLDAAAEASEEVTIVSLLCKRLRGSWRFDNWKGFVGALVTQLGQRAFFAISAALSIVALAGQRIAAQLRSTRSTTPEWIARLLARLRESTGKLRYDAVASKLFDVSADADGSGSIEPAELYCMCLELYCLTTQYMPQVLTPPKRHQTDALFKVFDTNHNGTLDKEEVGRGPAPAQLCPRTAVPPPVLCTSRSCDGLADACACTARARVPPPRPPPQFLLLAAVFYEMLLSTRPAPSNHG